MFVCFVFLLLMDLSPLEKFSLVISLLMTGCLPRLRETDMMQSVLILSKRESIFKAFCFRRQFQKQKNIFNLTTIEN